MPASSDATPIIPYQNALSYQAEQGEYIVVISYIFIETEYGVRAILHTRVYFMPTHFETPNIRQASHEREIKKIPPEEIRKQQVYNF